MKWRGLAVALCFLLAGAAFAQGPARDVAPGSRADVERLGTRQDSPKEPTGRIDAHVPTPVERETGRTKTEDRLAGASMEEPPWWTDYFGLRMSASEVASVGAWQAHPSNRFAAHRGAGYRVVAPITLMPREPLLRYERGPWGVYGGASLTGYYTGNLFLSDTDEEGDFIAMISPQVGVDWSHPNFGVGLRYGTQLIRSRFNEFQRDNHQVGVDADWVIRSDLTARIENVYGWRTVAPPEKDIDFTRYFDNQTTLGLKYNPWIDWEMDLVYDRYQARFPDVPTDNLTINGGAATASRRVAPAVWAQGRLRYENTENHDEGNVNTDNDTYIASVGFRFEPLAPVTGNVHVGHIVKAYDAREIDDQSGIYLNGRITYSPREWIKIFWGGARSLYETSVTALNEPGGANYERTSTSAGARFDVADLWGIAVLGFYAKDDYTGPFGREDDLFGGRISLYRDISTWSRFVVAYQYQVNDSNLSGNDFAENYISVGLDVSF